MHYPPFDPNTDLAGASFYLVKSSNALPGLNVGDVVVVSDNGPSVGYTVLTARAEIGGVGDGSPSAKDAAIAAAVTAGSLEALARS